MANLYLADVKLLQQDTASVGTALSAYEKDVFDGSMHKRSVEKGQYDGAHDAATGSLSYLFTIFH